MSLTLMKKDNLWYWRNWLGLIQSPRFDTEQEAKEWKEKFK